MSGFFKNRLVLHGDIAYDYSYYHRRGLIQSLACTSRPECSAELELHGNCNLTAGWNEPTKGLCPTEELKKHSIPTHCWMSFQIWKW